MTWKVEVRENARRNLRKLDRFTTRRILSFLEDRLSGDVDPLRLGKRLRGELSDYWRYRVGDYRILCTIDAEQQVVRVVTIGHRSDIYR